MGPLGAEDPLQVGPYRIQGILGSGGMGRVYLGHSPAGRRVAVKVVRPELADDVRFRTRFAREVEAVRRVGGAWTAAVVDADTGADRPWLATSYIPGTPLHDAVAGYGPLPAPTVCALGAGLAEALAAIHGSGVVHRDLKPANILLRREGPCVIDFGIARALDADALTRSGLVVGSPAFMAPEQVEGNAVGPAADVFALGAVLVYAATGTSPFGSGAGQALMYRIVHRPPRLPGLTGPLRSVIESCLDKDPEQRPSPADVIALLAPCSPGSQPGSAGWLPAALMTMISAAETPGDTSRPELSVPSLPSVRSQATVTALPAHSPTEPDRHSTPTPTATTRPSRDNDKPPSPPALDTPLAALPASYTPGARSGRTRRRLPRLATYAIAVVTGLAVAAGLAFVTRPSRGQPHTNAPTCRTQPGQATSSATPPPAPGTITVNVANATNRAGLAVEAAQRLRARGFHIGEVGNYALSHTIPDTAVVRYGPAGKAAAAVVAAQVPGARLVPIQYNGTSVDLVLGTAFHDLGPAPSTPSTSSTSSAPSSSRPSSGC